MVKLLIEIAPKAIQESKNPSKQERYIEYFIYIPNLSLPPCNTRITMVLREQYIQTKYMLKDILAQK